MTHKPYHVLIVDDILENIQRAGAALLEQGYRTSFAESGKKALELCNSKHFDIILLDIMMPEMDGFEVLHHLKENPATQSIPVIFLTAKTETEDLVKGFQQGAVDYITKPFKNEELLVRVQTHLLIQKQKSELQELNQQKDKFFSIIAHDLRGPQNAIMGLSELLHNHWPDFSDADRQDMAQVLYQAAASFGQLLEELLTWARLQMDRADFNPEPWDVNQLATELIGLYQPKAQEAGVTLLNQIPAESRCQADGAMLSGVLRNLLTNAIKFTPQGGSVTLEAWPEGTNLRVTVTDTGIGIKPQDQEKLFRMDQWHTTPSLKGEKGSGLGLLLCKEFVEKNGGHLGVHSTPGEGTRFHFTVPLA